MLPQVSHQVGRPFQQCETLYKQHALYLNLASQLIQKEAFMGMVRSSQEHTMQVSMPHISQLFAVAMHWRQTLNMASHQSAIFVNTLLQMQNQLQQADSANFSGELRQHGSRSISTSAAVHSPRHDNLHNTPRHHIQSREPASMPKVSSTECTSAYCSNHCMIFSQLPTINLGTLYCWPIQAPGSICINVSQSCLVLSFQAQKLLTDSVCLCCVA